MLCQVFSAKQAEHEMKHHAPFLTVETPPFPFSSPNSLPFVILDRVKSTKLRSKEGENRNEHHEESGKKIKH